jgi:hypothetical protein
LSFNIASITPIVSAESGVANLVGGGTIFRLRRSRLGRPFGAATLSEEFAGAGLVQFNNATTTTLSGTIANNGNAPINSTGSFTDFVLSDNLTITGSGVPTLVNADRIRGNGTTNAGSISRGTSNPKPGNNEWHHQPSRQPDRRHARFILLLTPTAMLANEPGNHAGQ